MPSDSITIVASTSAEDLVALIRSLTLSQQITIARKARDFARQNRPKPQMPDKNSEVSTGTVVTTRSPKKLSHPTQPLGTRCPICQRLYNQDTLKIHISSCLGATRPGPPSAKTDVSKDEGIECPVCQGRIDSPKALDVHLKVEHNMIMCPRCHVAIDRRPNLLQKHLVAHIASDQAAQQQASALAPPSGRRGARYIGEWDDTPRVFQGGLCNKK